MSNPPELPSAAPAEGEGAGAARRQVSYLLSACLGLFVADGILSLGSASLSFFDIPIPGVAEAFVSLVGFSALAITILTYLVMGVTPLVPKRFFLPIALFYPAGWLLLIPAAIYLRDQLLNVILVLSLIQVALGAGIAFLLQPGRTSRFELVPAGRLSGRAFSWRHSLLFVAANVVMLAAALAYLGVCSSLAVDHFTDGFVSLRPHGLDVRIRKYTREDRKTIWLVPMVHIGHPKYYDALSKLLPAGGVVLNEGVTDRKKLLRHNISYARAATMLGLEEQRKSFELPGKAVAADLDVDQFSPGTIHMLNVVLLPHSKGFTSETLKRLSDYKPSDEDMDQCWDDLLGKRNLNLLAGIADWLPKSETIIVPWGAAHMPGIASGIQEMGFRCNEEQGITAIPFMR